MGDKATMGGGEPEDISLDDGIELVDLNSRYTNEGSVGQGGMPAGNGMMERGASAYSAVADTNYTKIIEVKECS